MRAEKAAAGKERAARDGSLESRMAMRVGRGGDFDARIAVAAAGVRGLTPPSPTRCPAQGIPVTPPSQGDWDHFTGIDARVLKAPESGNLGTLLMRARAPR